MWKFARTWFGPYVVKSANENRTYHLAEVDGTRMVVPVTGKRIKAFKKWNEDGPDLESMDSDDDRIRADGKRRMKDKRGMVFSGECLFQRIPVDARLGGGGCRGENHPQAQSVYKAWESALHACVPVDVYRRELGTREILGR